MGKILTHEQFMADLEKTRAENKREWQEFKKQMRESATMHDRQMQEIAAIHKEIDLRLEKTARRLEEMGIHVNGMSDSNGEFAEEFFYNSLEKTMTFAGVHFEYISDKFSRKRRLPDKTERKAQFDIVMHNGDSVALIEVKYKANLKDVREMVGKKIQNFRFLFPEYAKYKLYLGIGSLVLKDGVAQEAKKFGIGLMKQKGDAVEYKTNWVKAY